MTTKEWLMRGWRIDKEIKLLREERQKALDIATNITQAIDVSSVKKSRKNSVENKFVIYSEYGERLKKRIEELETVKIEIEKAIRGVEEPTLRQLLLLRYLQMKKWEDVAREINYDYYYTIKKLHPKALKIIGQYLKSQ